MELFSKCQQGYDNKTEYGIIWAIFNNYLPLYLVLKKKATVYHLVCVQLMFLVMVFLAVHADF